MKSEQSPEVWDQVSSEYLKFVEPFLGHFSDEVLSQINIAGARFLDVACGPGTMSLRAASSALSVDALDFSEEMISILRSRSHAFSNLETVCGDGQSLPYENDSFDVSTSMFGLMFFPDRMSGIRELARVTKPAGTVVIGAWASFADSELFRTLFLLLDVFPKLEKMAVREPGLEDLSVFRSELTESGLVVDKIETMEAYFEAPDVPSFWSAVKTSFAGLVLFLEQFDSEELAQIEVRVLALLTDCLGEGPIRLASMANVAFTRVPSVTP